MPCKWSYKWVRGVIFPIHGVITLLVFGVFGPSCRNHEFFVLIVTYFSYLTPKKSREETSSIPVDPDANFSVGMDLGELRTDLWMILDVLQWEQPSLKLAANATENGGPPGKRRFRTWKSSF